MKKLNIIIVAIVTICFSQSALATKCVNYMYLMEEPFDIKKVNGIVIHFFPRNSLYDNNVLACTNVADCKENKKRKSGIVSMMGTGEILIDYYQEKDIKAYFKMLDQKNLEIQTYYEKHREEFRCGPTLWGINRISLYPEMFLKRKEPDFPYLEKKEEEGKLKFKQLLEKFGTKLVLAEEAKEKFNCQLPELVNLLSLPKEDKLMFRAKIVIDKNKKEFKFIPLEKYKMLYGKKLIFSESQNKFYFNSAWPRIIDEAGYSKDIFNIIMLKNTKDYNPCNFLATPHDDEYF